MTTPVPTNRAVLRVAIRATIVLAVALALVMVEFSSRSGVGWRLITFTYQANILAAGYYACTLFSARADRRTGLRGAVVLYVVVAGVIWNLLLTGRTMGAEEAQRAAQGGVQIETTGQFQLHLAAAVEAGDQGDFAASR